MQEFFRGWKRKLGILVLIMACLLTAEWIRSRQYEDDIAFRLFGKRCDVNFAFGSIRFSVWDETQAGRTIDWSCREIGMASRDPQFHLLMNLTDLRRLDYELNTSESTLKSYRTFTVRSSLIVIPLILASTWLLFSKTNSQTRPKREEDQSS